MKLKRKRNETSKTFRDRKKALIVKDKTLRQLCKNEKFNRHSHCGNDEYAWNELFYQLYVSSEK